MPGFLLPIGYSLLPVSPCPRKLLRRRDWRKIPPGEHIFEETDQLLVDQAIRSQNLAAFQPEVRAGKVGHAPARLFHQQNARSRVPGIEIELPEAVQAAGRQRTPDRARPSRPAAPRASAT